MERDNTPETGTVREGTDGVDAFIKKAKRIVANSLVPAISTGDVYLVWFSKTLQNWKALLSTDLHDGLYYEVTYNGDKKETYLDTYRKINNRAIPDKEED